MAPADASRSSAAAERGGQHSALTRWYGVLTSVGPVTPSPVLRSPAWPGAGYGLYPMLPCAPAAPVASSAFTILAFCGLAIAASLGPTVRYRRAAWPVAS